MDFGIFKNLPDTKYDILIADPPWSYHGQQDKWGAAAKFYPTVSDEDLLNFPMRELMADKSILFMWVTGPRFDFGVECCKSWGLYYRGVEFVWVKTNKKGVPLKAQGVRPSIVKPIDEFVIGCSTIKKGRPLPIAREDIEQNIFAPKQRHSQKPKEVIERIHLLYPEYSKLELFARDNNPYCDVWGNEI